MLIRYIDLNVLDFNTFDLHIQGVLSTRRYEAFGELENYTKRRTWLFRPITTN